MCLGSFYKMKYMDIDKIIGLVKETRGIIMNRDMAGHVKEKGLADYVTQVDFAVQNFLNSRLHDLYPSIGFLGEETGLHQMTDEYYWILDPVDGTTNLMHDYQHSVVSLALCSHGEITMGIIYDPYHDELFSATRGEGSFLNGKPIHVSDDARLQDTIIGVGCTKREPAKPNFDRFLNVYEEVQDLRRLGSAALELAYTACGRQGGYFEHHLYPWDFAAGILLVREAGGKITDWSGNDLGPATDSAVVATNSHIHSALLKLLQ